MFLFSKSQIILAVFCLSNFMLFSRAFIRPASNHLLNRNSAFNKPLIVRHMGAIAEGVEFDTIAREWRCKWSADNDKASLVQLQKLLNEVAPALKATDGVKSVNRVVCGGCLDFKMIVSLDAEKFGPWAEGGYGGMEEKVLGEMEKIPGVSSVESQTFTFMPV